MKLEEGPGVRDGQGEGEEGDSQEKLVLVR